MRDPMKLPSDYCEVLAEGAATLSVSAANLRTEAARHPENPAQWLAVRDLEGLVERLSAVERRDWENGSAVLLITGQDVGALDELLCAVDGAGEKDAVAMPSLHVASLTRLANFLRQYLDDYFRVGAPAAFMSATSPMRMTARRRKPISFGSMARGRC